jgi:phospholipase C
MTPKAAAAPVSSLAALIDHVVIIVKENHTYDNYFGTFPNSEGDNQLAHAQNPPPSDPDHRHQAWEARANDQTHMVQYNQNDIPTYFALAEQYTICDHYFSEVAGPSTPNHLMLIAADAPIIDNPKNMYHPTPGDAYDLHSLPMALEKAGLTWGNYGGYAFQYIKELAGQPGSHQRDVFLQSAAAGKLPSVSWVYGDGRPPYSEHPLENVTAGSEWTGQVIDSIVSGGLWPRTVIFVTWDDWGGWYDHVDPPNVEQWNSNMAQNPNDANPQFNGQQFRYGSRVPCLVISPYAKKAYVSKTRRSHISLVKFCQTLLGITSINPRLDNADDMGDCFDPTQVPLPAPNLPAPTILVHGGAGGHTGKGKPSGKGGRGKKPSGKTPGKKPSPAGGRTPSKRKRHG